MRLLRRLALFAALAGAGLLALVVALLLLWRVVPPVSTLMLARHLTFRPVTREWVPLDRIAPALPAAVVMSEDARFCRHNGVDWAALREVIEDADADGPARGASTLTMQVAKNLFLWPGRSAIRKAIEIPLALLLDAVWPKRRIMEVYLNIAEWGADGTFGAQAGARRAFGKGADRLSGREAALMAASLPNPILRNPGKPSRGLSRHAGVVQGRLRDAKSWTDCVKPP